MLGVGKTGALATASLARRQVIYQVPAQEPSEDEIRYRLAQSVFRRCQQLAAGSAAASGTSRPATC